MAKTYFGALATEWWTVHGQFLKDPSLECTLTSVVERIGAGLELPCSDHIGAGFVASMRTEGYGEGTIRKHVKLARRVLNWANGLYGTDFKFAVPRIKTIKPRQRVLTATEQKGIAEYLSGEALLLFYLLIDTGARLHEALRLRRADFARRFSEVTLNRTKTGTLTTLPVSDRCRACLGRCRNAGRDEIFTTPAGATAKLREAINFICNARPHTDGPAVIHSLRHTFASEAVTRGVSYEVLGYALGHSSVAQTMAYVHSNLGKSDALRAKVLSGGLLMER